MTRCSAVARTLSGNRRLSETGPPRYLSFAAFQVFSRKENPNAQSSNHIPGSPAPAIVAEVPIRIAKM